MESKDMWHGTIAFSYLAIGAGIVAGVTYLLYGIPGHGSTATSTPATSTLAVATTTVTNIVLPTLSGGFRFDCSNGKGIEAVFSSNSVQLALSDGRQITLPQTISGSGARYANADESFVFWNKGNTAFITENGSNTYDGCATKQQAQ